MIRGKGGRRPGKKRIWASRQQTLDVQQPTRHATRRFQHTTLQHLNKKKNSHGLCFFPRSVCLLGILFYLGREPGDGILAFLFLSLEFGNITRKLGVGTTPHTTQTEQDGQSGGGAEKGRTTKTPRAVDGTHIQHPPRQPSSLSSATPLKRARPHKLIPFVGKKHTIIRMFMVGNPPGGGHSTAPPGEKKKAQHNTQKKPAWLLTTNLAAQSKGRTTLVCND